MASVNDPHADGRAALLEQMVTTQPDRLPGKMRAAGYGTHEADDLGQETLTRALRSLANLRGPVDEALMCGWVDSIATNLIRNQRRTMARRPTTQPLAAGETAEPSTADATEDLICRASLESLLRRCPTSSGPCSSHECSTNRPPPRWPRDLASPRTPCAGGCAGPASDYAHRWTH